MSDQAKRDAGASSRLRRFIGVAMCLGMWIGFVSGGLAWIPGAGGGVGVKDFSVDVSSRRDVLAFYHAVYGASEGYATRSEWTGDVAGLQPGTTGTGLKNDVLRRINFYRALAGLPADVILNIEKSQKAQEAALIVARNGALSHAPEIEHPEWVGLKQLPLGTVASANSNLSLGAYGPGAVDGQMRDDGESNWQVGHRRWLLYPRLAEIGTGDVPAKEGFSAGNAIWVYGDFKASAGNATGQYALWPNRGYIPADLLPKRWSVSCPGADFSGATVSVSCAGKVVPVSLLSRSLTPADNFQGDPTLVWEPNVGSIEHGGDVAFRVRVSGIRVGSETRDLEYDVVAFDPRELGEVPLITSTAGLTTAGGMYAIKPVAQADEYQLTVALGSAAAWLEGAEDGGLQVLANTAPGYAVVQSQVVASGRRAFHLAHSGLGTEGFADQILQLKRRLVPGADSVLQFSETGRFAETTTTLNAEVSVDEGLSWATVWSRAGAGLSSTSFDAGWNPHAVSMKGFAGRAVLVRFRLKSNGGPVAAGTTQDHGFFLDNIVLTNGVELVEGKVSTLPGTSEGFALNSVTAGAPLKAGDRYYLSVAPRVGGRLFAPGPVVAVSVPAGSAMAAAPAAVVDLPVIRLQPVEAKVAADNPAVFNVLATGTGPLSYQWRRNGVAISGGTAATLRIGSAQKSHEAAGGAGVGYDVVVTGPGGSVTSERAGLTVVEGGVPVVENPSGGNPKLGASYTMRVGVLETELTYQWRKNGVAIAGATAANLVISAYEESDAGRYDVVLRNAFGEVVSAPAYLGVASKVVPNLQKATYEWSTLAGNGLAGFANGAGLAAQFNAPSSIAADGLGNLYVADSFNHVIRKVTQTGVVTTVAGSAGNPGSANGSALSAARFDTPEGVAVDKAGSVYIAESGNNTVRKLTNPGLSTASVTTIAGVAGQFGVAGGLNGPRRVAVDPSGKVYLLDFTSIRRVDGPTQFTLLLGALTETEGIGRPMPMALTVDGNGRLFAGVNEAGEFRVFSQLAGGTFAATNYGPYPFALSDLALGAGNQMFAATDDSIQLLGDVSQSTPAAGFPVNLTAAVTNYAAPRGITADASGTVFAVDPFLNTVLRGVPTGLPVFLQHPAGATGLVGVPLTLAAAAIGTGTVSYQWYRDGYPIPGATEPSYTLASGALGLGVYTVEASNAAGSVTSIGASVVGQVAPLKILEQPQSTTVVSGVPVALRVSWQGPTTTTFQWFRGEQALSGGTAAVYGFSAVTGADAGDYRVQIKSGSTVLMSDTAKLTVSVPVSIFNQPEPSIAVGQGKPLSLRVSATGTPPLSYQWYRNGVALAGGTSAVYNIPGMTDGDAGTYTVEVANPVGKAESEPARVTILIPPSVVTQPGDDLTVNLGVQANFSVTAAGSQPLTYQWRKDGVPLRGSTAASLSLPSAREADAGVYDVLVSNSLGTALSKPVRLKVNLPPTIVSQPPVSISAAIGTSVPLRVVVTGTGPFFYRWLRGGTPIPGAVEPTYMAPTLSAGTSQYVVEVTSAVYGTPVVGAPTTLTVSAARAISILQDPAPKTNAVRGTAALLSFTVEPNPPGTLRTVYRLVNHPSGKDTGITGIVPANGDIKLPLRALVSSGSYAVVLSREYSDKQVISGVKTGPFFVELRGMEEAAGTYEILLADSNGQVGDGGTYRGLLLATVTKTGAVSGRVLYNEAPPLSRAPPGVRAYSAVTRSFSASFLPSADNPSKLVCAPKLGVGAPVDGQALELELDFSEKAVVFNGLVRDRVSVLPGVNSEGCVSKGMGAVRVLTKLSGVVVGSGSADFGSAVGRYALGSEFGTTQGSGPGADNNATLLAQVLATGKVVWASRVSGSTGTGSSTLNATDQDALTTQIYQAKTVSTTAVLSTSSILGQLRFERQTGGTLWSVAVSSGAGLYKLERQSCHIAKVNKVPVYQDGLFNSGAVGTASFNWSGKRDLEFEFGTRCAWTGSTNTGFVAFFNGAKAVSPTSVPPLYLTAEDPVTGDTYVWTIIASTAGTVRATNYQASAVQPVLTFRLDKTQGEWTGSFTSLGASASTRLRCNLAGVVARPADGGSLRGAGWVEVGSIPATRTGAWRLELSPP